MQIEIGASVQAGVFQSHLKVRVEIEAVGDGDEHACIMDEYSVQQKRAQLEVECTINTHRFVRHWIGEVSDFTRPERHNRASHGDEPEAEKYLDDSLVMIVQCFKTQKEQKCR